MPVTTPKILAPVGGWNTRDPLAAMPAIDAVVLNNIIPEPGGPEIRPGYALTHTLASTSHGVDTLFSWKTQFGELLIGGVATSASSYGLYDITKSTVATIKTGFVKGNWDHANMLNAIGMVNGADDPIKLEYTPGTGVQVRDMNISGVPTSKQLSRIHIYKSRSWFTSGAEPACYYSAVNALGGALTKFPVDRVSATGGNVIEINSWTRDGGIGPDDYLVLFLDTGEILVYAGSNPNDANDFGIVGRYTLGRVLTTTEFSGKIHAVTEDDYAILPDDLLTEGIRKPTKLSGAVQKAVRRDRSDNWSIFFDTGRSWRIVNVPQGQNREQHVTSLTSGAATRFNINANVWSRFNGELHFGGASGKVYKMRDGDDDGTAIEFACQQAFTDFGNPRNKTPLNYRLVMTTNGNVTVSSGIAFDYDKTAFIQSHSEGEAGSPWDTSSWNTASWGVEQGGKLDWLDGAGEGQSMSLFVNGTTTKKLVWHHTDYRIDVSEDVL